MGSPAMPLLVPITLWSQPNCFVVVYDLLAVALSLLNHVATIPIVVIVGLIIVVVL